MRSEDLSRLLAHLHDQAQHVTELTVRARSHPDDREHLVAIRDELFTMRETLDTLGVPDALVTNAEWNRNIGTKRER
jgi:hypothetical protein